MGMLQPGVTHVGGSSAGALAAAVVACELPIEAVLESVRNMMADCRERGVWRRLGPGLRAQVGRGRGGGGNCRERGMMADCRERGLWQMLGPVLRAQVRGKDWAEGGGAFGRG